MIIAVRAAGVMTPGSSERWPASVIGTSSGPWCAIPDASDSTLRVAFTPGEVAIMTKKYSPREEDIASGRKIVAMNTQTLQSGRGSFAFDGKMIHVPIIVRAGKLIARREAIKRREAATLAAMES
jgi:hypothetical protein